MIAIRKWPGLLAAALLVSFMLVPAAGEEAQEADRAYVNGHIYTVDENFSTATALAVKDGRFVYVGDDAGVRAHIGSLTFVIDLKGKTVIPGLHDAHVHINYGERILYPRIPDIRPEIGEWASVERMQAVIKRCLATGEGMRPGPEPRWLVLGGWIPGQAMTREEALRAATMGGAYVMFAEDILGSIEVGKLADFLVLPVDYMTIPAEDIWKIEPDMTVIGGEVVYARPLPAEK